MYEQTLMNVAVEISVLKFVITPLVVSSVTVKLGTDYRMIMQLAKVELYICTWLLCESVLLRACMQILMSVLKVIRHAQKIPYVLTSMDHSTVFA